MRGRIFLDFLVCTVLVMLVWSGYVKGFIVGAVSNEFVVTLYTVNSLLFTGLV